MLTHAVWGRTLGVGGHRALPRERHIAVRLVAARLAATAFLRPRRCGFLVLSALASFFGFAQAASAQTPGRSIDLDQGATKFDVDLIAEARLRYEFAEDEGFSENSSALTFRVRAGLEVAPLQNWRILAEFEGLGALVDEYNDGINGASERPVVADPEFGELNRFQLSTTAIPFTEVTGGRQRISLDDERFLGPVAFRQNEQTYDGVRISTDVLGSVALDAGYFGQVNRILSGRNPAGKFKGDSYYVNASASTPLGRLSAFHYAFDLAAGPRGLETDVASSVTTGFRLDGRWTRRRDVDGWSLAWEGAYARQRDFAQNPNDYAADYWLVGATLGVGPVSLELRNEVLGAGGAQAFQAPIGTLHKFQGAADVFLTTPVDGVADRAIEARWRVGSFGALRGVSALVRHHRFEADRGGAHYGDELDLALRAEILGASISLEYATYWADAFAEDTISLWVAVSRAL